MPLLIPARSRHPRQTAIAPRAFLEPAMNNVRTQMDSDLKALVVPALRDAGFKGSMPHFRRTSSEAVDLLTFQFDKWGGGFVIEIARSAPDGFTTPWGKHILPSKVTAHDLYPNQRLRIQPAAGSGTDSWFRFEDGQTRIVAQQVVDALPRAESWWREAVPVGSFAGLGAS